MADSAACGPTLAGGGILPELPFRRTERTSKRAKTLNNPKDRSMTTSCSDLALTVPATHRGKVAFAHITRDESQAMIQPLILELSVKISRRAALLEASSNDPAQCSEDIVALAWIQRSLEDIEATIIGLSAVNRRRGAAFRGPDPSSAGTRFPKLRWGQPPPRSRFLLTTPAGYRSSPRRQEYPACPKY